MTATTWAEDYLTPRDKAIYADGQRAFDAGKPRIQNPHKRNTQNWLDWKLGWLEGWSLRHNGRGS